MRIQETQMFGLIKQSLEISACVIYGFGFDVNLVKSLDVYK